MAVKVLSFAVTVPDDMYCGYIGLDGYKCPMCVKWHDDYWCMIFRCRLPSDVSGPLREEECLKRAK